MSYEIIRKGITNYIIHIPPKHETQTQESITLILDTFFSFGDREIVIITRSCRWSMPIDLWARHSLDMVHYIHARIVDFEEIHCTSRAQAELIVQRLDQLNMVTLLTKEYR